MPITLFAKDEIPVEAEAVEQLLSLVSLQETLESLDEQARAASRPSGGMNPAGSRRSW